ncbi:response regulator [Hymenobacter chitinivorans]|uniref:Response regulator receiver domain-containing protein n=1 Tax=Hymenobacter chitinivorans DSM 11115 TaxID=1121954 RepID=A0A2M9AT00_9BACT|nr:response regulator [Hymenobacter chitinivorans]PJJ48797.1 response regulator receiver domain-containing protein [Hymenobacter chitinivorans DSM 11115]
MLTQQILIVTHAPIIGEGLLQQLHRWGFQHIEVADSGPAALAAATRQPPDLVILTTTLPGPPDGLETARLLQRRGPTPLLLLQEPRHAPAQEPHLRPLTRYRCLPNPPSVEELRSGVLNSLLPTHPTRPAQA